MTQPIVVGYDGSESSRAALDLGVEEAQLRHQSLTVLYAAPVPIMGMSHEEMKHLPHGSSPIKDLMDEAQAHVTEVAPRLRARYDAVNAVTVSSRLVESSREFSLLVVGNRGRGGFGSLMLGSTSTQVAAHAHCPVIVHRRRAASGPHEGAIVVGVDGSELSQVALRFAFEEAYMRGIELITVHVWAEPLVTDPDDLAVAAYDQPQKVREETELLHRWIQPWHARFPDVTVTPRAVGGNVREVLLAESEGCQLLVVGSRGRGGFTGMMLGSTSIAMLHHSKCPIAVVHQPQ